MEENKIPGMLDEAIEQALQNLKDYGAGSAEYGTMVTSIAKLNEQRLAEIKLENEASNRAFDRAAEDEKMAHEKELKLEETRQTKIKAFAEIGKAGLSLLCTGVSILAIMSYEEFAPIVTKAFQFVPKPKF